VPGEHAADLPGAVPARSGDVPGQQAAGLPGPVFARPGDPGVDSPGVADARDVEWPEPAAAGDGVHISQSAREPAADDAAAPTAGRHTVPDELVQASTYRLPPDRVFRAKVRDATLPDEPTARLVPKPRNS
jgi:hypothetical protein